MDLPKKLIDSRILTYIMLSNPQTLHAVCILVKNYYDIETIENVKSNIAKIPGFRFFISPQYRREPKYDIYAVADKPDKMLHSIHVSSLMDYIEEIWVIEV